ncbi:UNVERIFIED_CONTAM: hypothetical protein Sangu_3098200 [Sesamum angustifolium]|uniref:Uncharacterized protein n=1 Tax=Sesamum angustifolium TaxID=2727405 RepID=A0AAW2K7R0_9LAMI
MANLGVASSLPSCSGQRQLHHLEELGGTAMPRQDSLVWARHRRSRNPLGDAAQSLGWGSLAVVGGGGRGEGKGVVGGGAGKGGRC